MYLLNNKNIEKQKISFDRQKIVCWKSNRKTQFKIGSFNIKKLATENISANPAPFEVRLAQISL